MKINYNQLNRNKLKSCGELQGCSRKPKACNWSSLDITRDIQKKREIQTYKQRTGKSTSQQIHTGTTPLKKMKLS